jgi:gamma-glutamyltranspeptidase/glutathione hydrolase
MEILEQGGNAMDAAVATAFALAVLDPASSGLGGGGFMVIYQGKEKKAHALDFREKAPAATKKDLYIRDGKVISRLSRVGPLSVAVPGEVAGLLEALRRFGSLPLNTVLAPSIRYATAGFSNSPQIRYAVQKHISTIRQRGNFSRIFLKADGKPYLVGETIHQPELGESLKAIAREGAKVFYEGWIGQAIVDRLKKEGGVLTLKDLKDYKPVWREPLLGSYRKRLVITMPPPSSGGVALMYMLNVLEGYDLGQFRHNSATYLHILTENMKHAYADRARYLGDPDFVQIPTTRITSKKYAARTRKNISDKYTHPADFYGLAPTSPERGGTTHFAVLDGAGNAVSSSLTINSRFGSKILVRQTGIILNNEMDDFSIRAGQPNIYGLIGGSANSIQPKKRPLSSMTPTIMLDGEKPVLIVGAAGGPRIITATLQTILNVLDFSMPLRKAVRTPRVHHQWKPNRLLVENKIPRTIRESLGRRGHVIKSRRSLGTVQAILINGGKLSGEADPRKARDPAGEPTSPD